MRVQSALLCEFAEVRNGLLTAVSTGITRVVPGAAFTPYVAGYFLSEVNEQRLVHEFSVTVLDQDAHQLWRAQGAMQVGTVVGSFQGEPLLAPFVMRIPPTPLIPGARYDVRVRSDDASEVLWFYTVAPPGSQPFRNLSHLSLRTRTGFGATCCRVAVTVLCPCGAVLPSSQFVEEHLGEPMNLSSPCAFTGSWPRPVPAPLAIPMLVGDSTREARFTAALRSRSGTRPQRSQR